MKKIQYTHKIKQTLLLTETESKKEIILLDSLDIKKAVHCALKKTLQKIDTNANQKLSTHFITLQ